jgi:hypothetical protein
MAWKVRVFALSIYIIGHRAGHVGMPDDRRFIDRQYVALGASHPR